MIHGSHQQSSDSAFFVLIDHQHSPFEYVCFGKFFENRDANIFLDWLESTPLWIYRKTDFYQQWELKITPDIELPDCINFLKSEIFVDELRKVLAPYFDTSKFTKTRITVHKMLKNQEIEIHNDFLPDLDAIRIIVQLNRGWAPNQGGQLILHNSYTDGDIHKIINPQHNTAIAIKISNNSLHSVTPIISGQRYTLVYSIET